MGNECELVKICDQLKSLNFKLSNKLEGSYDLISLHSIQFITHIQSPSKRDSCLRVFFLDDRVFISLNALKMCHRIIETEKFAIGSCIIIIDFVMEKLE